MKYTVGFRVDGRIYVTVEADNMENAIEEATSVVDEMDFGDIECIDWYEVNCEDENGNFEDFV